MRLPKTLSGKIDALWRTKGYLVDAELALSQTAEAKNVKKLQENINELEADLLSIYEEDETLLSEPGKTAKVKLRKTENYKATDWPAVLGYVRENGAWDMLTKRLSTVAINDRINTGEEIPGIQHFEKRSIIVTGIN